MEHSSKQLALAGRLKPEARLGVALSEFAQVLDSKRREEFRKSQSSTGLAPSGSDVIGFTETLNREGRRRHKQWGQDGTRVGSLLARVQCLSSIGDVVVGGSQNLIASGVWGAVKLCLMVSVELFSFFEKVATLFMKLGTSWRLHEDFALLFPNSRELQTFLCEYLICLVRLCTALVKAVTRSLASQIASSFTSTFESQFSPQQKELDQWGQLIEHKSQNLAIQSSKEAEASAVQRNAGLMRFMREKSEATDYMDKRRRLLQHLSPDQATYEQIWRRQRNKGTCSWIYETPQYLEWKTQQKSSTLWVEGKLGSGKSVALANIVADISVQQSCAHFFCDAKEESTLRARNLIGSLAFQLIENAPPTDNSWERLHQRYATSTTWNLSCEGIVEVLSLLLQPKIRYFIVIDGLEDLDDLSLKDVLGALRAMMSSQIMLLCCSSRTDSRYRTVANLYFEVQQTMSLNDDTRKPEIEDYIDREITRRIALLNRQLSPELESLVKRQLKEFSMGMYLWVSLQIDAILPLEGIRVSTDSDIFNMITNLPRTLEEAFENALNKIADKRYDGNLFKLVMAARRPLTLDELRVALNVVPGSPTWNAANIPRDHKQLISLCAGSLLEEDEEDGRVRFIHHSAVVHLNAPALEPLNSCYHFSLEDAEHFTGSVCVTYLNLEIFDTRVTTVRKLKSNNITEAISSTISDQHPVLASISRHWANRRDQHPVDIGRLLMDAQTFKTGNQMLEKTFFDYAANNWYFHTGRLAPDGADGCQHFWSHLISGGVTGIDVPLRVPGETPARTIIRWAVSRGDRPLFSRYMSAIERRNDGIGLSGPFGPLGAGQGIRSFLSDIIAEHLESRQDDPVELSELIHIGADPNEPHHRTKLTPLEIVLQRPLIFANRRKTIAPGNESILRVLLANTEVADTLQDVLVRIVPSVLFVHDGSALDLAIKISSIECIRRLLETETALGDSEKTGLSLVDFAYWSRDKKIIEALAKSPHGQSIATRLMWKSLSKNPPPTNAYHWLKFLLGIGANPNIGCPRSALWTPDILAPDEVIRIYLSPLQAALRASRYLESIELIRRGADVDPISGPRPLDLFPFHPSSGVGPIRTLYLMLLDSGSESDLVAEGAGPTK